MNKEVIFFIGVSMSCMIITAIMFHIMNDRFEKRIRRKWVYPITAIIISIGFVYINYIGNSFLNLFLWSLVFGLISYFYYNDQSAKTFYRVLEVEVMLLLLTLFESISAIFLEYMILKANIVIESVEMRSFLSITFSKICVLFFYFTVGVKLSRTHINMKKSLSEFFLGIIIAIYSIVNLIVIFIAFPIMEEAGSSFILLINMTCIVMADFYLLYFTKYTEENRRLKLNLKLFEQQSLLQHQYYLSQEINYKKSMSILHDIDKHIFTIEQLYLNEEKEKALTYTKGISKMLEPLIPEDYLNNPIFNILLHEKINRAKKENIEIILDIQKIDLTFLEAIDTTIIFGNILDNALEACNNVTGNRYIKLRIGTLHNFVAIHLENSMRENPKWVEGNLVSSKGENRGLGLRNVYRTIEKYNGDIHLSVNKEVFLCEILLNESSQ